MALLPPLPPPPPAAALLTLLAPAAPVAWPSVLLQVRKVSVKQVVSPIIFDNLKNAVRGGLYDPAFGPMDHKER